ncbi:efflux RND transporter periplasmic adaptor subunit [Methylococcus geothermalis]|uniref:efflux RND transporter periplasmic adaptor subunit n=1 Tax=Methylococcus geothermalis TaxID=2681310 RepID=UPI00146A5AB6|nr:efflux RND transporter periplasmic adaptor subunit [Methylococcus geothermalis]
MKKKILLFGLCALSTGLAAAYWPWKTGGDSASELTLYGNMDIREVDLGFGVDGPIDQVLVEEGDRVEAGQTLAILEQDAFLDAVQAAEATLKLAEARLAEGVHGPRPQEIERGRATVQAAEAALANAALIHSRRVSLIDAHERAASREEADTTNAERLVAEADLKKAREDLALLLEGTRREQLDQQRAEVEAQRANLALLRYRLGRATLKAPTAGVIRTRILEPGAVVTANSPVFTLALTDPKWCRAYVNESDLGKIRLGLPARITTDSYPGKSYRGWVGYISPVAEFTPKAVETPELRTSLVYQARVYTCDPDQELRLGMPATVTLLLNGETRTPPASLSDYCKSP